MSDLELKGILAAVTTPFTADGGAIDEQTLRGQVERLIEAGVHGLVPVGSTGEFSSLTLEEHKRVIELHVEAANHRVPVIAGVGTLTTRGTAELAVFAERVGANAIMVVPPFYDPLDFEGVQAFLATVSKASSLPICYYNIPSISGCRLSAAQLAELGSIEHVDYLKDTSGDAPALSQLLHLYGDDIKAFNGWDSLTFFGIASGAEAAIWGAAGLVPDQAVELLARAGGEGRPGPGSRAVGAAAQAQRLPRVRQLRRGRQGRPRPDRPLRRPGPRARPAASGREARRVEGDPRSRRRDDRRLI